MRTKRGPRRYGAYCAAKLAIVEHARLKAVVAQSPLVDLTFHKDFLLGKTVGNRKYLFGLAPALISMFDNVTALDQLAEVSPKLSLVSQGLLSKPRAPMLMIAGVLDTPRTPTPAYLLLSKGGVPKEAWINPEGGCWGR
jgi:esterase FrsA